MQRPSTDTEIKVGTQFVVTRRHQPFESSFYREEGEVVTAASCRGSDSKTWCDGRSLPNGEEGFLATVGIVAAMNYNAVLWSPCIFLAPLYSQVVDNTQTLAQFIKLLAAM